MGRVGSYWNRVVEDGLSGEDLKGEKDFRDGGNKIGKVLRGRERI